MRQQRESILMLCRLPESDQPTALAFLRALKAKDSAAVKQLQQQQQTQITELKSQLLSGSRQECLNMATQASELARYFMDRADADLMLDGGLINE